jgi:hypothetical protein
MSNADKCKPNKVQNINADTNAKGTNGSETSDNCFSRLQFELNKLRQYLRTQSNDPEKQRNIGMYLLAIYKRALASIKPSIITNLINNLKNNKFDAFFDYLLKNRESIAEDAPYIITKQSDANTILAKLKTSYTDLTDSKKNVAAILGNEEDAKMKEAFNAVQKELIVKPPPQPQPEVIPESITSVKDQDEVIGKDVPDNADKTPVTKLTIEVFVSSSDIKIKIEPTTKVDSDEGATSLTNATADEVIQSIIASMDNTFIDKFNAIYGGRTLPETASANSSRILIELFVSNEDAKIKIGPVTESPPDDSAISITAENLLQEIQSLLNSLRSTDAAVTEFLAQFSTLYSIPSSDNKV